MKLTDEDYEAIRRTIDIGNHHEKTFALDWAYTMCFLKTALHEHDRLKATAGIVFNSEPHGLLIISQTRSIRSYLHSAHKCQPLVDEGYINDAGRDVLAALNAQCKGGK